MPKGMGCHRRLTSDNGLNFFRLLDIVVSLVNDHNCWVSLWPEPFIQVNRYWIAGTDNNAGYRVCSVVLRLCSVAEGRQDSE